MERNIRLYPWYYAASSFLAWLPIFFLYFSEDLGLKEVLLLESIYYIAVVILEIPTGYFSDLVGRRTTLLIGAIFLCIACVFYLIGGSFIILTCGQIALALFMSFTSGTNTVFHYESLAAIGRGDEYGDREAMVNKYGMIAGGTSALLGGALALVDLRLAYVATFLSALVSLFIVLRMSEPSEFHLTEMGQAKPNIINQLRASLKYLRIRPLAWIAGYYVIIFSITHVPYEFYQPYIQLLEDNGQIWDSSTPILAGLLYAFARYIGAFGAAYSMVWKRKFGLRKHLIIQLLIVNLIVGAMSLYLHPLIIAMVLMRSLPWAAIKAPVNEIITPVVAIGQRATFHSMLSLACRFAFFCVLLLLSLLIPDGAISSWQNLRMLLSYCLIGGIVLSISILWTSKVLIKE